MAARKQYADIDTYINKLKRVIERLNVSQYDYDWTKNSAYVKFFYKNQWYQFDHTVEKANASVFIKELIKDYKIDKKIT